MAAEVDRAYIRETGAQGMYPMMYYNHNVHFESAAAAMAGRHAAAKKAGDVLFDDVLPVVVHGPMLEGFLLPAGLRGAALPEVGRHPEDAGPRAEAAAPAGGLALRARDGRRGVGGRQESAATLREAFVIARDAGPGGWHGGPAEQRGGRSSRSRRTCSTPGSPRRRGTAKAAIASWVKAVAAEDALAYDEPPAWYYPIRESLGAALLADGQAAEAEKVFRADLEQATRATAARSTAYPKSLEAQKKDADAAWARAQFETAWKDADTPVRLEDL